ncbi:MAG: sugar phosphate isomerase/epimerase family protein [Achromobacter pestifer]
MNLRLAISNIAWDVAEDAAVSQLLRRHGIDAIDVAPGKYFPEPLHASDQAITQVKSWWADQGIEITGMQALLFGTAGLNVFGPPAVQTAMLDHLAAVCRIASGLGAVRVVFGSPKNRIRAGLSDDASMDVALPFFRRLGDAAQAHGVLLCLEPNPTCYGSDFMTTSAETAQVVEAVAHPAIRMQFDTGALTINDEDTVQVLDQFGALIGHVHASEPGLLPLGDGACNHAAMHAALAKALPHHPVCIEMVATTAEPHLVSIERALRTAAANYRPETAGAIR